MCIFRVIIVGREGHDDSGRIVIVESEGGGVDRRRVGDKGVGGVGGIRGEDILGIRRGHGNNQSKEENGKEDTKQESGASAAQDGLKHRQDRRVGTTIVQRCWLCLECGGHWIG